MNPEVECTPTESTVIPIQAYQPQTDNNVFQSIAAEKIAAELKSFTGGQKEKCVSTHVAAQITHFCEESPEFAEVVYKTKRTLSDCCTEVLKGVGNHISYIDVYRGIVKAYFPNADVRFIMDIEINSPEFWKSGPSLAERVVYGRRPCIEVRPCFAAGVSIPR